MDGKADSARQLCSTIETNLLGRIRLPEIEGTYYSRSADFGERGLTIFTMMDLPTGRKWYCRLVNNFFVLLNEEGRGSVRVSSVADLDAALHKKVATARRNAAAAFFDPERRAAIWGEAQALFETLKADNGGVVKPFPWDYVRIHGTNAGVFLREMGMNRHYWKKSDLKCVGIRCLILPSHPNGTPGLIGMGVVVGRCTPKHFPEYFKSLLVKELIGER